MNIEESNFIIYKGLSGEVSVSLIAKDGTVWMNQNQLAETFGTSIPNINMHKRNILIDKELNPNSVIKNFLITAS